jgi:hypothetical protein
VFDIEARIRKLFSRLLSRANGFADSERGKKAAGKISDLRSSEQAKKAASALHDL